MTKQRLTSGIVPHASSAAMGFARALTSHARARYQKKYHGRYRFPSLLFTLDAGLLLLMTVLLIVNVVVRFSGRVSNVGIGMEVQTGEIRVGERVPVRVIVRSTDGQTHSNVHVRVVLPDWVELEDQYSNRRFVDVAIGELVPRVDRIISFIAIPYARDQQDLPFHVYVEQESSWFFARASDGIVTKPVQGSAVTAQVWRGCAMGESRIAILEFLHLQTGQHVHLDSTSWEFVDGGLDWITPSSTVRLVAVRAMSDVLTPLDWTVTGNGYVLASGEVVASTTSVQNISPTGQWMHIATWNGIVDRVGDAQDSVIPTDATDWKMYPIGSTTSACVFLPPQSGGDLSTSVRSELTQVSPTGEQIGAGPLPPQKGETTFAWVRIDIPPTVTSWMNGRMHLQFAPGVSWNGGLLSAIPARVSKVTQGADIEVPTLGPSAHAQQIFVEIKIDPTTSASFDQLARLSSVLFTRSAR